MILARNFALLSGSTVLCGICLGATLSGLAQAAVAQDQLEQAVQSESSDDPAKAPRQKVPVEQQLDRTPEGRIRFNFQGQPWRDVLQWLADASNLTMDWQTFPDGELNLTTLKSYSLNEARDLLNMYLAIRGYTLLRHGEVLSLVKLKELNPIFVPRVEVDELDSRDPHEFVRVSFPLDWLVADEAVKEFAPMLSQFGKLTPMKATNRIEAIDTAANLKDVRDMLRKEQSTQGTERLVVEFKLKHARADEIEVKLRGLLGLQTNAMLANMERLRNQFNRRDGGGGGGGDGNRDQQRAATPREPDVHLVVNEAENSILANASADKLAIIREAIGALDVPSSAAARGGSAVTRMKIYRTKAIDPDALRDLIVGLVNGGKLKSQTQVQSDDNSNTLIVYATPEDHLAIASVISQIDDGRDVRIIPVRRLDLDYALQSIKLLLQGEAAGGGGGGGGRRRSAAGSESFRVEADHERKRLLLWASDAEHDAVKELLAKLGETSDAGATGRSAVRVMNLPAGNARESLENLRRIWPALRDNPLHIHDGNSPSTRSGVRERRTEPTSRSAAPPIDGEQPTDEARLKEIKPDTDKRLSTARRPAPHRYVIPRFAVALAAAEGEPETATPAELNQATPPNPDVPLADPTKPRGPRAAAAPGVEKSPATILDNPKAKDQAPIVVTESPSGQLIISSQDVEALDSFEELLQQFAPRQPGYDVFRIKHVSPLSLELTLRQIFGLGTTPSGAAQSRLPAAQTVLKFVSDLDTGTLLVQNATTEQLRTIEALIDLYDQPETQDRDLERKTEIYELQYSRATAVAEVVKEVYRDLLSASDKTFAQPRRNEDAPSRDVGYGANYGSKIPKFKGLLSVGVEENSNSLVVSAPAYMIGDVMKLVRQVDRTAADHGVRVVKMNGIDAAQLRSVFAGMPGVTIAGSSTASGRPAAATAPAASPPGSASGSPSPPATNPNPQRSEFNRRNGGR